MTTRRLFTLAAITLLLAGCASTQSPYPRLTPGDVAADFTLQDAHGKTLTLSQIEKPTLIVFYLGYDCPRCVRHLRDLANHKADFDKLNVQVLAISPDTIAKSQESIHDFGDFPFPLLSDPDRKVAASYGVLVGKDTLFHGVFALDKDRKILFAERSDHPFTDTGKLSETFEKLTR